MSKFDPEAAQICLPRWPHRCQTRARWNASMAGHVESVWRPCTAPPPPLLPPPPCFSPLVPVWRSTRASPTSFTRVTRPPASLLAVCSPWQSTAMDGRAARAAAVPLLPAAWAKLVPDVVACSCRAPTLFLRGRKCPWPACSVSGLFDARRRISVRIWNNSGFQMRSQNSYEYYLWAVAWFLETLRFPVQDRFSFSFVLADFWVKFENA